MNISNCSSLPFVLTKILWQRSALADGVYSSNGPITVTIDRPLERQPLSAIRGDPFLEFIRMTRVVIPLAPPPSDGIEPDIHVRLDRLIQCCRNVSETAPQQVEVIGHRAPQVLLVIDHRRTLSLRATFLGQSQAVRDSRADFLYLSMLLEVAARFAELPVGRLTITWEAVVESEQTVLALGDMTPDEWGDCYTEMEAGNIIGTDPYTWVGEVDMLRTGRVAGLQDMACRRTHAPIIQAHKVFADEEEGARRFDAARKVIQSIEAQDWRTACHQWVCQMEVNGQLARRSVG